ncbi:hypothetical protein D9M71_587420 [compost metagenome]
MITIQECRVTQTVDHHRVAAIVGQGADPAIGLFGVQQAAVAAAGQAFGFGQAGPQYIQLPAAPVIAHQATIALAVFDGIKIVAFVPEALHALAVEQLGDLAIAGQADRCQATFLAEHPAALRRDHTVGLGQVIDQHDALARSRDLEDAAPAVIQFTADQQAAIRLR